jgi:hypothetical protein
MNLIVNLHFMPPNPIVFTDRVKYDEAVAAAKLVYQLGAHIHCSFRLDSLNGGSIRQMTFKNTQKPTVIS